VEPSFLGTHYGTWFMSPFWSVEFWKVF